MKKAILVCVVIAAVATMLPGQVKASVIGTSHDISSNGCLSCHAVHNGTGDKPSWGQTLTTETFTPYSGSVTLDSTPMAPIQGTISFLCLSCHDGVTTIDASSSVMTGTKVVGTNLQSSHPVGFTYDSDLATADGGILSPTSTSYVDASSVLPLFAGEMECATCHDAHDSTNSPFLRATNDASALCLTCHTGKA